MSTRNIFQTALFATQIFLSCYILKHDMIVHAYQSYISKIHSNHRSKMFKTQMSRRKEFSYTTLNPLLVLQRQKQTKRAFYSIERRNCLNENNDHSSSHETIDRRDVFETLPIFPLRKSVKFPTERLTLNLYEERFLALADFILEGKVDQYQHQMKQTEAINSIDEKKEENLVFGALYCSAKPQMVVNGIEPITPIIEVGDIGTLFSLLYYIEEKQESTLQGLDSGRGRKIKLHGIGIGRFRVEEIRHNGYGGGEAMKDLSCKPLPFIVVKASKFDDVSYKINEDALDLNELGITELGDQVFQYILNDEIKLSRLISNLNDRDTNAEILNSVTDKANSIKIQKLPFWLSRANQMKGNISSNLQTKLQMDDIEKVEQVMSSWKNKRNATDEVRKLELFSFAMSSTIASDFTNEEMIELMTLTSTRERLEFILQTTKKRIPIPIIEGMVQKLFNQ